MGKKEKMSAVREKEGSLGVTHLLVLQGHWPHGQQVCPKRTIRDPLLEEETSSRRDHGSPENGSTRACVSDALSGLHSLGSL